MDSEHTRLLKSIVVEGGFASERDLAAIRQRVELSGGAATPARIMAAMVEEGVITHGQAERLSEKLDSSSHGSASSSRKAVRAFCPECRQAALVRDDGELPPCPTCGKTMVYPGETVHAPTPTAPRAPLEGTQIQGGCGTYRIIDRMGAGGFSAVYRAHLIDERTGEGYDRALKVLHPHLCGQQRDVDDFFAEVRTLQRISHPSVVRVYESGLVDGVPFTVMDLVDGRSLKQVLDEGDRPVPVPTALTIAAQVASALREVHQAGLIHRDVKPGNIMLRNEGSATTVHAILLDFGIASVADRPDQDLLTYAGTKNYEAPEQAEGAPERASDIWGMGVVLYRMLNARAPHVPSSGSRRSPQRPSRDKHRTPQPFEKLEVAPRLQSEIEALTKTCLRLSPHQRPTAEKLSGELERLRAKALMEGGGRDKSSQPLRSRRGLMLVAGLALAALTAVPLWLARQPRVQKERPTNRTGSSASSGNEAAAKDAATDTEPWVYSSRSDRATGAILEIENLRSAGRLAQAFRAIDDLRILAPDKHEEEERQAVDALRKVVEGRISSGAFAEAQAAAKEVVYARSELAGKLGAEVEEAKLRFVNTARQVLATDAPWPQCGEQLRREYSTAAAAGAFDKAKAIRASFADSGETFREWTDHNLDKAVLDKAMREFETASNNAVRSTLSALAAGPDPQKWQAAITAGQALGRYHGNATAKALQDVCSSAIILAKSYPALDECIRETMGARVLKLQDAEQDADKLKPALEGEVRAKITHTRSLLDDLTRAVASLPMLQSADLQCFRDELRSRDPSQFLHYLQRAHKPGTSTDRDLWAETWSTYCDLTPRPLDCYRQKAIAYRDAGQSGQAMAARLVRIADLCNRAEFREAFLAIDDLRGMDARKAQERDRETQSALERAVRDLLRAERFAEATSMADRVASIRPQLTQALKSNISDTQWQHAHAAAKSTLDSQRQSQPFSKDAWEQTLAVCKRLADTFTARPEAAALLDDCTFYMAEAGNREATAASRWKAWKGFLAKNPRSTHADAAKREQASALREGQQKIAEVSSAIKSIADTLDAQSDEAPKTILALSESLKQNLTQKVDQAEKISKDFDRHIQLDRAAVTQIQERLAFEICRARATAASEPLRGEVWKEFFSAHRDSACAGRAQKELTRLLSATLQPTCRAFDEKTKTAPDQTLYSTIREEIAKASSLIGRYQELFGDLRDFDISTIRGEVAARERRLSAILVMRTNTESVALSLNGQRIDGAAPVSYPQVVSGCSYRIGARKPGWRPYELDVTIADDGPTTVQITLEQLQPRLPQGLDPTIWQVPSKDVDQHGNPVVTRDECLCDPDTRLSYEIWLSRVELRGLLKKERVVLGEGWLEFVLIPAGKYLVSSLDDEWRQGFIGGEGLGIMPPYVLDRSPNMKPMPLARPLYVSKYEITADQFAPFDTWKGRYLKSKAGNHPAFPVPWTNATKFCQRLHAATGVEIRLPTDAEWECSCRAGATTRYPWGNDLDRKYGSFPIGTQSGTPLQVGSFPPNRFGLYDMIGSVREWCAEARQWPALAISRGGDFTSPRIALTAHFRYLGRRDSDKGIRGFRICAVP